MNLDPSSQNRHKEDPQRAEPVTPTPVAPVPPPGKLRRGRPSIKYAPQACDPGLRGKCWWLMRELTTFTVNQLLETCADGTEKEAHTNIRFYLARLEAHGVLERLERRQPGEVLGSHGRVVWRLKRNLGRLAPVWRRQLKVLWDPNRQQVVEMPKPPAIDTQQPDNSSPI